MYIFSLNWSVFDSTSCIWNKETWPISFSRVPTQQFVVENTCASLPVTRVRWFGWRCTYPSKLAAGNDLEDVHTKHHRAQSTSYTDFHTLFLCWLFYSLFAMVFIDGGRVGRVYLFFLFFSFLLAYPQWTLYSSYKIYNKRGPLK